MSEKTEEPTPKRLRDAREKGNLMKSQEVISLVVMFVGVYALLMIGVELPRRFEMTLDMLFRLAASTDLSQAEDIFVNALGKNLLEVMSLVFGAIVLAGILSNIGQIGFYFSFSKFGQGLNSLDPVKNVQNLVSKKTLVQFGVNLLKVLVILGISWKYIGDQKSLVEQIYLCRSDVLCTLREGATLVFRMLVWILTCMTPIAVVDWVIQRHIYIKDLKMSIDEVHREYKEQEGSPEMKGHRKQVAHEIVNEEPTQRTRDASVVVRNPTHVAVALRYEPDKVPLPYVVGKGTGAVAELIIQEAERHGIPTYEDVPLARGLNEACDLGDHVPSEYIEPLARVIRWLYVNYPQRVYQGTDFDWNQRMSDRSMEAYSQQSLSRSAYALHRQPKP
ncbi:MAG: EscU/YscU/HrcU family type III secretion system export apparatus switch protein [Alphaproteobacteria bacterium]|nr:EscU/YscU/HrcU family type III secretion system export apparatus switch protein [Alphaproteobacteria bacterium]